MFQKLLLFHSSGEQDKLLSSVGFVVVVLTVLYSHLLSYIHNRMHIRGFLDLHLKMGIELIPKIK
jgi:hypothetical protein